MNRKKNIIAIIIAVLIFACLIAGIGFKVYKDTQNEKETEIQTTIKSEEVQKEENTSEELEEIATTKVEETEIVEKTTNEEIQKVEKTTNQTTIQNTTQNNNSNPGQYTYPYPSWFEHHWSYDLETGEKIPGSDYWIDPRTKITYYEDGSYCEDGGF